MLPLPGVELSLLYNNGMATPIVKPARAHSKFTPFISIGGPVRILAGLPELVAHNSTPTNVDAEYAANSFQNITP